MLDPASPDALVESVLASALLSYAHLPGAAHGEDADLVWIRSSQPYASMNHVLRLRMRSDGFEERVRAMLEAFEPDAFPMTWWVGPTSEPAEAGTRLHGLGFQREEPEYGMILDLAHPIDEPLIPPGVTLEPVEDELALGALQDVQAAAYDWGPDWQAKHAIYRWLYGRELRDPHSSWHHFLLRLDGVPAAGSTLRVVAGQGFVTNIGTAPFAQGKGLGTAATVATLHLARRLGLPTAVLTASVDGRSVYRRLGFVEHGVLDRYVAVRATLEALRNRR